MEEFIIIKQSGTPYLCSEFICLNDEILFESERNSDIFFKGIVKEIDSENQLVTIDSDNQQFIREIDICFFPIIELFKNNRDSLHKTKILRSELYFKNICTQCLKESREIKNSECIENNCKKNNTKPYAFIKL